MKLLNKPKTVVTKDGRVILESEHLRNTWSKVATCGTSDEEMEEETHPLLKPPRTAGCGAVLEVSYSDLYKVVIKSPIGLGSSEGNAYARCVHCGKEIFISSATAPWEVSELPTHGKWLKSYEESLVAALYTECDPKDRPRLFDELVNSDNIDPDILNIYNWES